MSIYQPAEDSFLMSRILKEKLPELLTNNPHLKFLEIGAGSGIHLETAKSLGVKNILSSDIDKKSVSHCNLLGFNCIHSDLFEKIKGMRLSSEAIKKSRPSIIRGRSTRKIKGFPRFDIIIFNPPYLPQDEDEPKSSRLATTGGKKGNEIILKFLKQAKNYLEQDGKIFLITSSLAENVNFEKLGYQAKEIGCERLFFERLCIWELDKIK